MTKHVKGAPDEQEAEAIALRALVWTLADERRADRLLSLTGLTPERLREGLQDRQVQAAILEYLANYEPDLIAFAGNEALEPERVMAAADRLAR